MMRRACLWGGMVSAVLVIAGGCTAVLGIDKDYHPVGEGGTGGTGGTTTTTSTGGSSGSSGSSGSTGECVTVADCTVQEPECRSAVACNAGVCSYQDAKDGKELSGQPQDQCTVTVCDGMGGTRATVRDSVPCYSGPPSTLGVGPCAAGTQACDAQGNPTGVCAGEVLPAATEICANGADDDCSGMVDDGCACTPNTQSPCYSGPLGTEGVGICKGGMHTCNPDGMGFGTCNGEILPELETCDAQSKDEDCDGLVDEDGPGCFCGDGKISIGLGEQCDQGGTTTATCDGDCTLPSCGDGFLNPLAGEECDDGNTSDGDACSALCKDQKVLAVAPGNEHTCAILSGGVVKCWGWSANGELGVGDKVTRGDQVGEMGAALPAVNLGAKAIAISAGYYHTCALLQGGAVKCWGANGSGELGLGDSQNRGDDAADTLTAVSLGTGLTAVAISAGASFTCALLSNSKVKCWGYNGQGQLGLGDTTTRGDNPGEMGDALPFVDLGPGATATAVTIGNSVACALLTGGTVKCWGQNVFGSLGLGDTAPRGDQVGEMGASLPAVSLGTGLSATFVAAGDDHVCALLSGQNLKCWGDDSSDQLGLNDMQNRGDNAGEMGDALPLVSAFPVGVSAVTISGGDQHTCALRTDSKISCWGANFSGQAGFGQPILVQASVPNPAVDLGSGLLATSVEAGLLHTCAVLTDGGLKCWGVNNNGQLGLGDTATRGDGPGEMGNSLPHVTLFNAQW